MFKANYTSTQDPMDFNDETAAARVGARIRRIRSEKGLSQAELGEMVGLTADRIQKYENGARKPKSDLLKRIAEALQVSTLALVDPVTTNHFGALFAMFELESTFNMKIEESNDNEQPAMRLTTDFRDPLYEYMKEWHDVYTQTQAELKATSSDNEKQEILKSYHDWEWNFPKGISDRISKELQKRRLQKKIDELQAALDKLY